MSTLNQLRDLLTYTRNASAALDARGVKRNLSRLYDLVNDEGLEIDPEGFALYAVEQAQETVLAILDGEPEWDEMPDAIDEIEDEIDWD